MGREIVSALLTLLLAIVAAIVISAIILGMGSLLSRVFAVSVFEASLVALVVSGAIAWLFAKTFPSEVGEPAEPEEEIEEWLRSAPLPPLRSVRKRRR